MREQSGSARGGNDRRSVRRKPNLPLTRLERDSLQEKIVDESQQHITMMREGIDSWFSSLGAVTPRNYQSGNRQYLLNTAAGSSSKRHPVLQEFESKLAEKLDALRKAGEELGFLSIDWLPQALSVVLSTHANVQTLIPTQDDKCVRKYLDDSAKLLEVCNMLLSGFEGIYNHTRQLMNAISKLQDKDLSYCMVRNKLLHDEFLNCLPKERWRSVHAESELESCRSMLRTMSRKLISFEIVEKIKSEATGNRFFNVAIYGAKVTTIFLCGLVVSALARRPLVRHPLVTVRVSRQCLWASSLLSVQQRVKVEIDKRNTKTSSIPLLAELPTVDMLVSRLHNVVNTMLMGSSEHIVDDASRRHIYEPLDFNTPEGQEFRSLVASLDAHSKSLLYGWNALRNYVKRLSDHLKLMKLGAQHHL